MRATPPDSAVLPRWANASPIPTMVAGGGAGLPRTPGVEVSSRRWLALCGIASPVIIVVAVTAVAGRTPDPDAKTDEVMTYYQSHLSSNRIAALLVAIGGALLVLFALRLRELLTTGEPRTAVFATGALAGAILGAAGLLSAAVVHFTLVDVADNGLTSAAEALNALDGDTLIAAVMGLGVMFLAAGIAILLGRALPRWLGWAGVVIGVVAFAGPIGFFAALLGLVWLVITGVTMFRRADDVAVPVATPA
jgi:hypothetical protein